ncbi:hypothetical protein BLNAU_23739 [Blattamonas nauphoetae]|uniref:Uncharacterized protein n=1 Tax=Blattamonas nauphoetae TaxID=2049346 RepID=A0ABQ9WTI9_9EUKA|nr:hypothetical protein BLNAU_23739 [Blattamonas nauphoetae]
MRDHQMMTFVGEKKGRNGKQGCSEEVTARNGGVAWIELAGANWILVKHEKTSKLAASFTNCVAVGGSSDTSHPTGKGGALFVTGTSTHATPISLNDQPLYHAHFEDNLAESGNDLFITSELFGSVPTSSLVSFGGGSFSYDHHVAIEGRSPEDSAKIGLLIPTPIVSVNGSVSELMTGKSGEDVPTCKWTSSFCATLGYGITHLTKKYSTGGQFFPQSIQFVHNLTFNETEVVVKDQDVSVVGTKAKTPAEATVARSEIVIVPSTTASSLFTIKESAKLSVSGLDLWPIAKCGLFCVESGGESLKLFDVGIVCSLEEEYSEPLTKSDGRPIELCTFNTTTSGTARLANALIQLVHPSGGAVPLADFTLSSVSFSDFETTSDPLVVADTDGKISVVGTTFTRCSCSSEIKGTLVRVKTSGLDTSITRNIWSESFSEDTEAGPHVNCGSSSVSCSSLESGVASSLKFSISRMSVSCACEMSSPFTVSSSFTIESQFKIDASSAVLLLSSLQIGIDCTCSSSGVFVASKGTLHLSSSRIRNVEFTHESEGSAIVLHTSAGFSTDSADILSGIWSNGTGSHLFVNSADLSQTAVNDTLLPFNSTLSLPTNSLLSEIEKKRFFGREGLEEWCLCICGMRTQVDQFTSTQLGKTIELWKSAAAVLLDCGISGKAEGRAEWTLTQSTGACLWIEGDGQLSIGKSSTSELVLSGISMKIGPMAEG